MTERGPMSELLERLGMPAKASVEPAAGGASASAWRVNAGTDTYMLRRSSAQQAGGVMLADLAPRDADSPELLSTLEDRLGHMTKP